LRKRLAERPAFFVGGRRNDMTPIRVLALAGLLALGASSPAFAWGADGHRMIGELAMRGLPASLPAFLRAPAAAAEVGYLAPEADRIRGAGTVNDKERDPAHFIDTDDEMKSLGGPSLKALPPTREEYDTTMRAVNQSQYKAGYLPYEMIGGYELVRKSMAMWRLAVLGAKIAPTAAERARFAADRRRREARLITTIGLWSHFVGDGSQPLHSTIHYNGWGNGPNPEGFTTERIHTPFESLYVSANVTQGMVRAAMPAPSDCACAIEARVGFYLVASAEQVVPLYRLEKGGAFKAATGEGTAFATQMLARGAAELRDLIVMAWKDSDNALVGYPGVKISDLESRKVPFSSFRE
jgi:hypothetical protein